VCARRDVLLRERENTVADSTQETRRPHVQVRESQSDRQLLAALLELARVENAHMARAQLDYAHRTRRKRCYDATDHTLQSGR